MVAICANIATSPPTKQRASATQSATSVIGGNSALFRSGQGRCSRPDVAVILPASQRLSVNVIMATIVAAAGAMMESAVTQRSMSPDDAASRDPRIRIRPRRSELVMVSASLPSVSMAAIVVNAAKPAIQSRMRPTGYHSN